MDPIPSSEGKIIVTCAIIFKQNRVLAVQRGPHKKNAFKWEFPGGKLEKGETLEACIEREMMEELSIDVVAEAVLEPSSSPSGEILLFPLRCNIRSGEPVLSEHVDIKWLDYQGLFELDWAVADIPVRDQVAELMKKGF